MNQIPGTDLKVFPITLGTMTYGSPVAFDDAVKLTQYAVSRGVNLIDTANMYEGYNRYAGSAGGVAEEIVGRAVRGLPHGSVAVATKVGMKVGPAPEDEGTSPAAIRKQLDRSLARLGMDCIDLYYLHRPDESVPLADILGALSDAQRAGKIRYYGVSNYSAEQLAALLRAGGRGAPATPGRLPAAAELPQAGGARRAAAAVRGGGHRGHPLPDLPGRAAHGKYRRGAAAPAGSRADEKPEWMMRMDDALFDRIESFAAAAQAHGKSMAQYAIRWTLEQPAVVSAIVGVKNEKQVDDAVAALA